MPQTLGNNKSLLLTQVREMENTQVTTRKMTPEDFAKKLKELLDTYSDLRMEDYRGYVSDNILKVLEDMNRDPNELNLWKSIEAAQESTISQIEDKLRLVNQYVRDFPGGPKIEEAKLMADRLNGLRDEKISASEWDLLNKRDYNALRDFRKNHPNTVHLTEVDDYMWNCTVSTSKDQLQRYLEDWRNWNPVGSHVEEAERLLKGEEEWDHTPKDDIFELKKFMDAYPSFCQTHPEVSEKYKSLRSKVLEDMKNHPENYNTTNLTQYIDKGIFTEEFLRDKGIMPNLPPIKGDLPELRQFQAHTNHDEAKEDCTDVYLFGVPGTGKTCLLMGLTGAEGNGYTIKELRKDGGKYASALQQYVNAGVTPARTPAQFVTTIFCQIEEKRKNKRNGKEIHVNHNVNFVEMSGEEFAYKIANNDDTTTITDMGEGTQELLRNKNRKVFFIIIDPTVDYIEFIKDEKVEDDDHNVIGVKAKSYWIRQSSCLEKFVDLFEDKENKEFMKKVDAIHFIVTKADTLGDSDEERKKKARQLMIDKYRPVVTRLVGYCRRTKRVNYATDFHPMVYPFSLGRFFPGGRFEYNGNSTLKIINAIRHNTAAVKEEDFFDWLRDTLA